MDVVLGALYAAGRAHTVSEIRKSLGISESRTRHAVTDLMHKGFVSATDGVRPIHYRITPTGRAVVAANPRRFTNSHNTSPMKRARMNQLMNPGPDGASNDNWNEPPTGAEHGYGQD
jgi:DNA-binding MarR family transcriptional regulator